MPLWAFLLSLSFYVSVVSLYSHVLILSPCPSLSLVDIFFAFIATSLISFCHLFYFGLSIPVPRSTLIVPLSPQSLLLVPFSLDLSVIGFQSPPSQVLGLILRASKARLRGSCRCKQPRPAQEKRELDSRLQCLGPSSKKQGRPKKKGGGL